MPVNRTVLKSTGISEVPAGRACHRRGRSARGLLRPAATRPIQGPRLRLRSPLSAVWRPAARCIDTSGRATAASLRLAACRSRSVGPESTRQLHRQPPEHFQAIPSTPRLNPSRASSKKGHGCPNKPLTQKQKGAWMPFLRMYCGKQDLNLHGITTTRPSTWRVCQFRHSRGVSVARKPPPHS